MDTFNPIEYLASTCTVCREHGQTLSAKYRLSEPTPPLAGFAMCHNWAMLAKETIDLYSEHWQKTDPPVSEQKGRIKEATKSMFVFSISALEHMMREVDKMHPKVLSLKPGKHMLMHYVNKSHALGLITPPEYIRWKAVMEMRHAIAHNNGVPTENSDISLGNGVDLKQTAGASTNIRLSTFSMVSRWTIDAYAEWCDAFLAKCE